MTKKEKINCLINKMNSLDADALICVHNEWCNRIKCHDLKIYKTEQLNDVLKGLMPFQIVSRFQIDVNEPYFIMEGYSFTDDDFDFQIDKSAMAKYCVEKNSDLGFTQLKENLW